MELNKYIDSTNLKMEATASDITKLCEEAIKYNFESVCVSPCYVTLAKKLLEGTNILVDTVVGFPFGTSSPKTKQFEAIEVAEFGADEIDMVINVGALKDQEYDYVKNEIEGVRDVLDGKTLKIIIETSLLTKDEIIKMTEICNETFVNFIKTSTGFGIRGASLEDIDIINEHKNELLQIKASGGIKSYEEAEAFINKGVTRIGTSNAAKIMKEWEEK